MQAVLDEAEAYATVHDLIYHQVNKFHDRFGGDFDDLESDAHLAWLEGHRYYEGGVRASGATIDHEYHVEIRRWVWFELFDAMRVRASREQRGAVAMPAGDAAEAFVDRSFDGVRFADKLGNDARYVLGLVLDPPLCITVKATRKGGEPRNIRSTLRAWLRDRGWCTDRINYAFDEIGEAL